MNPQIEKNVKSHLSPVQSSLLSADQNISHGFFSNRGGASSGIHESLNVGLGSSDNIEHILENRNRVQNWFRQKTDNAQLITPYQIHSAEVTVIDAPFDPDNRPKCDGFVTKQPGLILGILTADCGPILFADEENGVIGAAHAGWRGAFEGVIENTIDKMISIGAHLENIKTTLGPLISQKNYEVDEGFYTRFIEQKRTNERYFLPSIKAGHYMFDLRQYCLDRLINKGVSANHIPHCTYQMDSQYFSYRRTTHRGEESYGRQISAIMINQHSG